MNTPRCPHCGGHAGITVIARYHFHRTVFGHTDRRGLIASRNSRVRCGPCGWEWTTEARVTGCRDAAPHLMCCDGFDEVQMRAVIAAIEASPAGKLYPDWHAEAREREV